MGAADWRSGKHFRWQPLTVPTEGHAGFRRLGPEITGIDWTNSLGEWAAESNRVLPNGSGVAIGDFNGDGLPDLFLCSLEGRNTLYQNLGGFHFRDVTRESGIVLTNPVCRGAVFADLNGDGRPDLLVAVNGLGVRCFLNQGNGKFADASESAGLLGPWGTTSLAVADVDGNGTLDVYVVNYRTDDIKDRGDIQLKMSHGKLVVPEEYKGRLLIVNNLLLEYGDPSFLYLNDGHAHFSAVSWTNGTFVNESGLRYPGPPLDWGLTASFRDINGDGAPDLYVCNDYWTPDRIWINDGKGRFHAMDFAAMRSTSANSMGVDMADLDQSGHFDIFALDMMSRDVSRRRRQMTAQNQIPSPIGHYLNRPQLTRNTLQIARGDGTFAEIANFAGLAAADWAWSPLFIDIDLDGLPDILVGAGHYRDVHDLDAVERIQDSPNQREQPADPAARREAFIRQKLANSREYKPLDMPIVAFRNRGGYRFEDVTRSWGTDELGIHHALALGDLDGDGDLDLVVNNLNGAFVVYRNESVAGRIAVRLKGLSPNTEGIGSQLILRDGAVPLQHQEMVSGGHYMAGCDTEIVFAAGNVRQGMTLEVNWRSGRRSVLNDVEANRRYEIEESDGAPFQAHVPSAVGNPLFEDVSTLIHHAAIEAPFDDFSRQPLLPRKLSQLGPGVLWMDLDGDGREDLVIGAAKGDQLGVYRNDPSGRFIALTEPPFDSIMSRDVSAVVGRVRPDGSREILLGISNYEDGQTNGAAVESILVPGSSRETVVEADASSSGPLALTDMNGDGWPDLFVGGRVIAGRYPESASSRILLGSPTGFHPDPSNRLFLESAGLVSGAVWSDLDGDGWPELILACEWGPVRVFRNRSGILSEVTATLGLADQTGWWNGVSVGDFDGDGRLDIVASNWGLNSPYSASEDHPAQLYYGNLSEQGVVDLVETEFDRYRNQMVPRRTRKAISFALPDIAERFCTHREYSEAPIDKILGTAGNRAHRVEARTLVSTVFLNRGDHFEPVPLPREAQWSPAFATVVADFDGDGREDIFLSQNFSPNQPEVSRQDAGRSLLLRGDGTGHFNVVDGAQSGLRVYGDQRGAAACDYDGDGRADLVVTQSGAETHLFHNRTAKPGLRVRLHGPPNNPMAIGAQLRLKVDGRWGPLREIHAGSGYWSQDGAVQVLGFELKPESVWVRWPGGTVTETPMPTDGAREVSITAPATAM